MNNYFIVAVGMILGQLSSTAIIVYIAQKKKDIGYTLALKTYLKSEQGGYVVAFIMMLVVMFLIPDYIEPVKDPTDTTRTWLEKVQAAKNFRLYSYCFGVFAPLIALVLFKKGLRAIKTEDAKISDAKNDDL